MKSYEDYSIYELQKGSQLKQAQALLCNLLLVDLVAVSLNFLWLTHHSFYLSRNYLSPPVISTIHLFTPFCLSLSSFLSLSILFWNIVNISLSIVSITLHSGIHSATLKSQNISITPFSPSIALHFYSRQTLSRVFASIIPHFCAVV